MFQERGQYVILYLYQYLQSLHVAVSLYTASAILRMIGALGGGEKSPRITFPYVSVSFPYVHLRPATEQQPTAEELI